MTTERLPRFMVAVVVAATAIVPVIAVEETPSNHFVLAAGGSELGGYILLSWTSPSRVGTYLRAFPFLYDMGNPTPNSTSSEDTAGEIGIAVRANSWLTVGLGYSRVQSLVTTYGDPDPSYGNPYTLGSETTVNNGIGAVAIFAIPSRSQKAALALSASISDVASGVAIGITFGP